VEGPSENGAIEAARGLTSRNMMATLMLSLGVPMITAGDELGRTQQGNNNAYCQDNPITWIDWTSTPESHAMLRTTKRIIRMRKEFLAGQPHDYPTREKQSYFHWFDAHGERMSGEIWQDPAHRVVQLLLGSDDGHMDGLVVVNGSAQDVKVTLPLLSNEDGTGSRLFELRLTTSELHDRRQGVRVSSGERDVVQANSISIYRT
jgi:glycogen operon protein